MKPMDKINWRIIHSKPARGDWNMAVDEAILLEIGAGRSIPTLRLYSWEPACLSLGYAQSISDVDFNELDSNGWSIVRRPTGGKAILHTDELTYAVIAPPDEPRVAGSVLESYRRLSAALLKALQFLGLDAQADPNAGTPQNGQGPVCFEVPSNYEITVQGKKLIGSAQARKREGVLQHGSLPLYGDLTRITRVLIFSSELERVEAAHRLMEHATTVEIILKRVINISEAVNAFHKAFSEVLAINFIHGELSPAEFKLAEELVEKKYGNSVWTDRI